MISPGSNLYAEALPSKTGRSLHFSPNPHMKNPSPAILVPKALLATPGQFTRPTGDSQGKARHYID